MLISSDLLLTVSHYSLLLTDLHLLRHTPQRIVLRLSDCLISADPDIIGLSLCQAADYLGNSRRTRDGLGFVSG